MAGSPAGGEWRVLSGFPRQAPRPGPESSDWPLVLLLRVHFFSRPVRTDPSSSRASSLLSCLTVGPWTGLSGRVQKEDLRPHAGALPGRPCRVRLGVQGGCPSGRPPRSSRRARGAPLLRPFR